MKKRGELTRWFLLELLAGIFVAYLAADVALAYVTGSGFEKLNVAKDIAMSLNAVAASPSDTFLIKRDLHGFSIKIKGNKIEVFDDITDHLKAEYYFVPFEDDNIDVFFDQPSQIVFKKINGHLLISEDLG